MPATYGDDRYTDRSKLRAAVWEISGGQCEHPITTGYTTNRTMAARCVLAGVELAHVWPRGMGHTGYRDTVNNTMCACHVHARSTDDLGDPEWENVPGWQLGDVLPGMHGPIVTRQLLTKRAALQRVLLWRRRSEGWAL